MIEMLWRSFVMIITNPYIIILLALCVLVKILYPKFRGFMGEFWVKEGLKNLPKEEYAAINDIMIEQNGNTHQIDHIVISRYGVFVIEMKNYYGLISGDEYKSKWVQRVGKSKRYFQNPIHQNYGHIKALEALLNLSEDCFIPIVCF
ncbi:MAG: NERD domain-containing protein, partial [Clostridia bacterium]|nr:NERD domain-containing protein [Clostridia bacterium]